MPSHARGPIVHLAVPCPDAHAPNASVPVEVESRRHSLIAEVLPSSCRGNATYDGVLYHPHRAVGMLLRHVRPHHANWQALMLEGLTMRGSLVEHSMVPRVRLSECLESIAKGDSNQLGNSA